METEEKAPRFTSERFTAPRTGETPVEFDKEEKVRINMFLPVSLIEQIDALGIGEGIPLFYARAAAIRRLLKKGMEADASAK